MSNNLTFKISAETKEAQQALADLLRSFQSLKSGASLDTVGAGASRSIAPVAALTAAVGGLAAAAASAGFALKKGLNANAAAESAQLGIKTVIASLYDMRDANGVLLEGTDALAVAGTEADKQLQALRVAGMSTAATFEELSSAFQVALGTGAGAGLGVDQIRQLTVDLVQAASAFSLQGDQLNSEIRAILSGNEIDNSQIAQGLGLTGAQIKLWREQGTLVENLNERLKVFRQIGDEAGKTWTATLSNLSDGITLFLRQSTAGAFDGIKTALQEALAAAIDPKSGAIKPAFQGIADLATEVFTDIGDQIANMIDGAVSLAQELSAWLTENRDTVLSTYDAFKNVFSAVGDVIENIASAVGMTAKASAEAGVLRTVFNTVALMVAATADGMKILGGTLAVLGGTVVAVLVAPLKFVAQVIDQITGSKLASYADTIQAAALKSTRFGTEMFKAGVALENVRKTEERIRQQGVAAIVKPGVIAPAATGKTGTATVRNRQAAAAKEDAAAKRAADKAAREAEAQARRDAAALDALNKALADYSAQQAATLREKALAQLDADLDKQLLSQQEYYRKRADIETQALDREKAVKEASIAELQKVMESEKAAQDERLKAAADIVKLRAELEALDGKKAVIAVELDKNSEAVRRYLAELKQDLQANLLDLQGDTAGAARSRLLAETERMLADARVKGDAEAQALIRQTAEAKGRIIDFEEASRVLSRTSTELGLSEQRIQRELTRGTIDDIEAQRQVREARLGTAEAMREQVEAAEKLAALTGDPERILEAKRLREAYEDLAGTLDSVAVDINQTFFGALKQGFNDLVTGAKSFGDVMRNIITSVLSKLADLALNRALSSLMGSLGGAGGGLGGLLSGLFSPRATGGAVSADGAYIVGERGAETFFPGMSGTIVPTSRLQSVLADMLGFKARKAPNAANNRGLSSMAPVGGNTNVSVAPKVVVAAGDFLSAIQSMPEAERWIVQVASANGKRIKAAW